MLVLKRLSAALAEGDPVLAIIRGSAVNHDGPSSGLTVPNGGAQQDLIRTALANAGVAPSEVSYVEAHGTGTSLGDPIEVEALGRVLGEGRPRERPLLIGSVKTNIGHLEPAAGIAGVMKVVLALRHKVLPPNLHFRDPSPHIAWDELQVRVPTEFLPWQAEDGPRVAGVSSFGLSGTNAHVILEEAPAEVSEPAAAERPAHLLVLSARSPEALQAQADRLARQLDRDPEPTLADVCHTAAVGRAHFSHRLALVATSRERAQQALAAFAAGGAPPGCLRGVASAPARRPKVAFLFTGQGAQHAGMGRTLYETQPVFRDALDQCDAIFSALAGRSLLPILLPEEGAPSALDETEFTQPALFALEHALAALWQSWGVTPDAVLGHSVGEFAAACVAGVFSLEDGMRLVAERGRLMQALPRDGVMAAARAGAEAVSAAIAPYAGAVSVAALNGPDSVVISGERQAVRAACDALRARGVEAKELNVSHAFHSHLMDPMLDAFERLAADVALSPPGVPLLSNVTGAAAGQEITSPSYWRRHVREPVRFAEGVAALHARGCEIFVEIGPHPTLIGMAAACAPEGAALWLPSLRRGRDDWEVILESLGALYTRGAPIDWRGFDGPYRRRRARLPTYPFERRRCWVDMPEPDAAERWAMDASSDHPLLGRRLPSPGREIQFVSTVSTARQPYLDDHKIYGEVVVPGAFHIAVALCAAEELLGEPGCALEDLVFPQALAASSAARLHLLLEGEDPRSMRFQIASPGPEGDGRAPWRRHATGALRGAGGEAGAAPLSLEVIRARCAAEASPDRVYDSLWALGIQLGPVFRCITQLWSGDGEALAAIRSLEAPGEAAGLLHPAQIDACFQVLAGALPDVEGDAAYIPIALDRFRFHGRPSGPLWCHAALRPRAEGQRDIWEGDLRLFEETGRVIAEMEGLRLKRAPREELMAGRQAPWLGWLYEAAWRREPLEAARPAEAAPRTWILFEDGRGLAAEFAARLEDRGDACVRVIAGEAFACVEPRRYAIAPERADDFDRLLGALDAEKGPPVHAVVYLWSVGADPAEGASWGAIDAVQAKAVAGALHVVQALARRGAPEPPRLWLVTRGAQRVGAQARPVDVAQAPLWGLGRTIALEHPELGCKLVDLDAAGDEATAEALARELVAESLEEEIALRADGRHVGRLVQSAAAARGKAAPAPRPVGPDGTYLITGGLGGLGLSVAGWLVGRGARHLVLVGRQGAATPAQAEAVVALRAAGAEVTVAQADVSVREQIAEVLADVGARLPPLRGVIHAAGVLDDGVLLKQDAGRFRRVMGPKGAAAWHLHELTRGAPLDFFVLYSSAASLLGSPGQGNYAAANAVLDALAHHRRALGLPALSVSWSSFGEVGMAADQARHATQPGRRGPHQLTPDEGTAILGGLLEADAAQIGVIPIEVGRWAAHRPQAAVSPRLSQIARGLAQGRPAASAAAVADALLAAPQEARGALIERLIVEQISEVMRIDASQIPREASLMSVGLDSLMGLELRTRLEAALKLRLPPTLAWNHPSVAALTEHLRNDWEQAYLARQLAPSEAGPTAAGASDQADDDIVELEL